MMRDELQEIFLLAARYYYRKHKNEGGLQKNLAEQLGITQSYLSSVIKGTRPASLKLQNKIANILYGPYDKFLETGRSLKNGLDPEQKKLPDPDENVEALMARITHYVVDHKRIEQELVNTKIFYEQIIQGIQNGVIVTNSSDEIYFVNNFMVSYAGVPKEKIIGTNMITDGDKFQKGCFKQIVQQYILAKKGLRTIFFENVPVTTPAGQPVYHTGWMIPQVVNDLYNGMIITIMDSTKSQKLSKLLTLSLENSEHAIGVIEQQNPGDKVGGFFMNKNMRKLFDLEGLYPERVPFNKVHVKTREHIQNSKEWEKFSRGNLKSGRSDAKFIIEHTNGKRYEWWSVALTDENSIYCGRMITVRKTKQKKN